jgi:uncharacterized UBP type Zn finger protein
VADICGHLDQIEPVTPSSTIGCSQCIAQGERWMHLRLCLTCGEVGCCDSSPNKHATAHFKSRGHPLMRSVQPGEDWCWCFEDGIGMRIPQVTGSTRIPPSPMLSR